MEADEMNHPLEYELVAKEKVNRMLREGMQAQQISRMRSHPSSSPIYGRGGGAMPSTNHLTIEVGKGWRRLVGWLAAVWGGGEVKVVDAPENQSIARLDPWEVRR
jgi:hypothetical protein